jgi:hypothetical protein
VPLLSEPDEAIEDGLGPLHSPLRTAQNDLIPPHDDFALDELLDPPQDGVAIPEDLERPAWRYDELDFYLAAGCGFRVASLRSALVSMSARSGLKASARQHCSFLIPRTC